MPQPNAPAQCLRAPLQALARQCSVLLQAAGRGPVSATADAELQRLLAAIAALDSFGGQPGPGQRVGALLDKVGRSLLAPGMREPAARQRMLVHAFRLLQLLDVTAQAALLACLQQRVQEQLCNLGAADTGKASALLHHLRQLRELPCMSGVGAPPQTAASRAAVATELLLWQQYIEQWQWRQREPRLQPACAALQRCLHERLAALARLCQDSDWTLAFFCTAGLLPLLQCLQLAAFASAGTTAQAWWCRQGQVLLDLHLAGRRPGQDTLVQWFAALYRCLQQGEVPAQNTVESDEGSSLPPLAGLPPGAAAAELAHWQGLLEQALQACHAAQPAAQERLQRLLYTPGWLLLALDMPAEARVFRCAWQLCAQYRHLCLPLPPALLTLLARLPSLLHVGPARVNPDRFQNWQTRLLQLWPGTVRNSNLDIPLAPPGSDTPALVNLQAVPDLLAVAFDALLDVRYAWFEPTPLAPLRRAALQSELLLLEKSAAALQLWPLEQWATLLLELHGRAVDTGRHPAPDLLWQAHLHLREMLDQAAAWQEPKRNDTLLQQLQQWLAAGDAIEAAQVCEPAADSLAALQTSLRLWMRTVAVVVERPVRLKLRGPEGPPAPLPCRQLEAGLKPLLKFLLLDNAADLANRRASHRPRISTFEIRLSQHGQTLLVEVGEDSQGAGLDRKRLQRLQRALPAAAGRLDCEVVAGHGRRLRFSLPAG